MRNMTYVMSDLHGCYDKYMAMLEKIGFSDEDTLYILGDVCDRGEDGIKILQDMMTRPNVIPLLGNHDWTFYAVLQRLKKPMTGEEGGVLQSLYADWLAYNGGTPTVRAYLALSPEERKKIEDYLGVFRIYEEVTAGGKQFFLSHAGIGNFEPDKPPEDYDIADFVETRIDYDRVYFPDRFLVTGHTPTGLIHPAYTGKILMRNNHIAIDCGAVFGYPLGCLCLDTLEEFYTE